MSSPHDFKVIVCGAIKDNNKFLVGKRAKNQIMSDYWEFPGGKLEHGEELTQALKREIQEELSLKIEVTSLICPLSFSYDHGNFLILLYDCRIIEGTPNACVHSELQWMTIDEMKNSHFLPANYELIKKLEEHHSCNK